MAMTLAVAAQIASALGDEPSDPSSLMRVQRPASTDGAVRLAQGITG